MTEGSERQSTSSSSSEEEGRVRMDALLDALTARFDPNFAERAAEQLSLAAEIVEANQGVRPKNRASRNRSQDPGVIAGVDSSVSAGRGEVRIVHPSSYEIRSNINYGPYEMTSGRLILSSPSTEAEPSAIDTDSDGEAVQTIGVIVALAMIFASTALILISAAIGLAGMYFGLAVFFASQFAAHQVGTHRSIVSPDLAAVGFAGAVGLVATAIVAAV